MASDALSLVEGDPLQIPTTFQLKHITAPGRRGIDGSKYTTHPGTASRSGQNGRDASSPTDGGSGGDIEVGLKYDHNRPGLIQVIPSARAWYDQFELSGHEQLFLDVQGGKGGDGGYGEDGQDGANGHKGLDASSSYRGHDGGPGGRGGDGGHGTSGANGGNGGKVSITVPEDQLDVLIAVGWNIDGGLGGKAGRHGRPGKGGRGGPGGNSHIDSRGHRHSGGRDGPDGRDGRMPNTLLNDGYQGKDGSVEINVAMRNGASLGYADRYRLVVDDFDVIDEGVDGIYEPGEFLKVTNITVRNEGPMPSPSGQLICVIIRESPWLDPDTTNPLVIPDSILSGQTARIPGELRAFIRHETSSRGPGEKLECEHTVSLLAYSSRLHRSIPEFWGGVSITIQYPIVLPPPSCMDCMTKDNEMRITWTARNISKRGYGHASSTKRSVKAILTDVRGSFVLHSASESKTFMENEYDKIPCKSDAMVHETFTVASHMKTFSTGYLNLELQLSDPHSDIMRTIIHHEVRIQVSEDYVFNAESQFLIIVNAFTENQAITQMLQWITQKLHLGADIFNLSLRGTFVDEESRESSLLKYRGKSIIVSGNGFTYFNKKSLYNWDLIDPQDALKLLMSHTGLLFCGVKSERSQDSLAKWVALMKFPIDQGIEEAGSSVEHNNRGDLLRSLRPGPPSKGLLLGNRDKYVVCNADSSKPLPSKVQKRGKALVKKLDKQVPTRRFLVITEKRNVENKDQTRSENEENPLHQSPSWLSVSAGLSRTANCRMSRLPIIDSTGTITSHQVAMMIASLPFHTLIVIFWNMIRSVYSSGINADALYRSLPGIRIDVPDMHGEVQDYQDAIIDLRVCMALAWAVEHSLYSEIRQLCSRNPMVDTIDSKSILDHAPQLQQFLNAIPHNESIIASEQGIALTVQVLASLNAALGSSNIIKSAIRSIPGLSSRRAKLRKHMKKYNEYAVSFLAPPSMAWNIKSRIREEAAKLRREATELRRNSTNPKVVPSITHRKLGTLTTDSASPFGFDDVSADQEGSVYLDPVAWESRKAEYGRLVDEQRADMARARATREARISRVYSDSTVNYIRLTSFR